MINEGERAKKVLDGACMYAGPWDLDETNKFFYRNMGGLYSKSMGSRLNSITLHQILPKMKAYMTDEEYKYYENALQTNKHGLQGFDEKIYPRMFGYKDANEYYQKESLMPDIHKIKVPTFALHSKDDQFIPNDSVPYTEISSENSSICLAVTSFGMHACHVSGLIVPACWYDVPIIEWFNFLEEKHEDKKN